MSPDDLQGKNRPSSTYGRDSVVVQAQSASGTLKLAVGAGPHQPGHKAPALPSAVRARNYLPSDEQVRARGSGGFLERRGVRRDMETGHPATNPVIGETPLLDFISPAQVGVAKDWMLLNDRYLVYKGAMETDGPPHDGDQTTVRWSNGQGINLEMVIRYTETNGNARVSVDVSGDGVEPYTSGAYFGPPLLSVQFELILFIDDVGLRYLPRPLLEEQYLRTWTFETELADGQRQSGQFDMRGYFLDDVTSTNVGGQTVVEGDIVALPEASDLYPSGWYPLNYPTADPTRYDVESEWRVDRADYVNAGSLGFAEGVITHPWGQSGQIGHFSATFPGGGAYRYRIQARTLPDGTGDLYVSGSAGVDTVTVFDEEVYPDPFYPAELPRDPEGDPEDPPEYETVTYSATLALPDDTMNAEWTVDVVGEDGQVLRTAVASGEGVGVYAEWDGLDDAGELVTTAQNASFVTRAQVCGATGPDRPVALQRGAETIMAQTNGSCTQLPLLSTFFGLGQDLTRAPVIVQKIRFGGNAQLTKSDNVGPFPVYDYVNDILRGSLEVPGEAHWELGGLPEMIPALFVGGQTAWLGAELAVEDTPEDWETLEVQVEMNVNDGPQNESLGSQTLIRDEWENRENFHSGKLAYSFLLPPVVGRHRVKLYWTFWFRNSSGEVVAESQSVTPSAEVPEDPAHLVYTGLAPPLQFNQTGNTYRGELVNPMFGYPYYHPTSFQFDSDAALTSQRSPLDMACRWAQGMDSRPALLAELARGLHEESGYQYDYFRKSAAFVDNSYPRGYHLAAQRDYRLEAHLVSQTCDCASFANLGRVLAATLGVQVKTIAIIANTDAGEGIYTNYADAAGSLLPAFILLPRTLVPSPVKDRYMLDSTTDGKDVLHEWTQIPWQFHEWILDPQDSRIYDSVVKLKPTPTEMTAALLNQYNVSNVQAFQAFLEAKGLAPDRFSGSIGADYLHMFGGSDAGLSAGVPERDYLSRLLILDANVPDFPVLDVTGFASRFRRVQKDRLVIIQ